MHTLAYSWNKAEKINCAGLEAVSRGLSNVYSCWVSPLPKPLLFLRQHLSSGLGLRGWAHHSLPRPTEHLQQPFLLCDAAPTTGKEWYCARLNQAEIDNLNILISGGGIELGIKKLPTNESPGPDSFMEDFYQTYKEESKTILLKLFQKIEVYGIKLILQG